MATMSQERAQPSAQSPRPNFFRNITPYLYIIPALLVMTIITYYPMAYNLWMSFTNYGIANLRVNSPPPDFVGLQNYIDILTGNIAIPNFDFWYTLAFNLWWTFSNVIFHVSIGILIAVILNTQGLWFRGIYRAIFVLPIVIPTLVVGTVFRNMFDADYGAFNQMLTWFGSFIGLPPVQLRWIDQVDPPVPFLPLPLAYFALLITNIWLGWPFMTIVASGALQSINKDYYEAASIDGASGTRQFFSITLPLLRPAMVPAAMYGMIITFNLFNLIYFITQGGPLRQTDILVTTAFNLVNAQRLYGVAAAFGVFVMLILIAITIGTNRISKATESYDA